MTLPRRTVLLLLALSALVASTLGVAAAAPAAQLITGPGADISYPQCGGAYPAASFGFVGVNGNTFANYNPCLASELGWAGSLGRAPQLYILAADPGPGGTFWAKGGSQPCDGSDSAGCAYDYGEVGAQQAVATAAPSLGGPVFWWVDVEAGASGPTWSPDQALNAAEVAGELHGLAESGLASGEGIYTHVAPAPGEASDLVSLLGSVGDLSGYPLWLATGSGDDNQAAAACSVKSDTNGSIVYGQSLVAGFDADVACAPRLKNAKVTGKLSTTTQLSGSGLPGTTVSLRLRSVSGAALAAPTTVTVPPSGTWTAKVGFARDASVTVSGDSGTTTGALRPMVGVTLSGRFRSDGACTATVSGTTSSWWKGQVVQLKGAAKTVKVASRRTSHGGSYSAVVAGVCGRGRTVTASVDGKSGRQQLTEAGASSKVTVRTVR